MNLVEREAVKLGAMLLATEKWAQTYSQAPDEHAALIKTSASFQVLLTTFFKEMAKDAPNFFNWQQYNYQVQLAYDVKVIVNDQQIGKWDGNFIQVVHPVVAKLVTTGAQAAEKIYNTPLGIQSSDAAIQALTTKQVASLVGKKVLDDGSIVDNPNAAYNIMDTVRDDVAQSVKTSLGLGETTDQAIARMQDVISNPNRAALISNTESVNAFNQGTLQFGSQSQATGKSWETAGATDICADNEDDGVIDIDDTFTSGDDAPTAHPNCMCALKLVYGNIDTDQDAIDDNAIVDDGD